MPAPVLDDIEYLESLVDQKPTDDVATSIVDAIHGVRVMPPGTPLPGIVDMYRTPYLIELADNMSPSSPIRRTTCMKSVQSALTWFAENVIAAWSKNWPTKLLYLTATAGALTKWTKRIEPVIDSMGLREMIVSQNTDKKTRTTGDKALSKTFAGGGALEMGSLQSPSDLASDSIQVAIADEVDRAPEKLKSGEGNFLRVLAGRLEAFLWKAKLLVFSTPTTWAGSLIFKEFKLGDRREYFVPCKYCGHMFFMEFKHLVPEYDENGLLDYAWLKCPNEECSSQSHGGKHTNSDKTFMLAIENGAEWRPQAIPAMKNHRSYHISKMMVPVGLATWTNIYQEYINAKAANDMGPFYNLQLGLPYKESGTSPRWDTIDQFTGAYSEREIPDGVLFLTVAMDVQQGSKTDLSKPPRLEVEVIGHASHWRTWGIEYKVFTDPKWPDGPGITDPGGGAWQAFVDWVMDGGFNYVRGDGMKFSPKMMFIDSADGVTVDIVYRFTQRPDIPDWVLPCKGQQSFKKNRDVLGDEATAMNMMQYKPSQNARSGDVIFYTIATNHYKKHIYTNLNVQRETDPGKDQRMGFCDFPSPRGIKVDGSIGEGYGEHYFKMLTSQKMWADGSFHDGSYSWHEALDIRVYGLCAADVYLDECVRYERDKVKANAARLKVPVDTRQLQIIKRPYILDLLEKQTARRK